MLCLTVLFFYQSTNFYCPTFQTLMVSVQGDKILVFHTRSRVVSASSGSRPGHKVSGTLSKLANLNENGQKSHVL